MLAGLPLTAVTWPDRVKQLQMSVALGAVWSVTSCVVGWHPVICTVVGLLEEKVGGVSSCTVTVALQELVAPPGFVAGERHWVWGWCVYGPVGLSVRVSVSPSGSDDPLSTSEGAAVPWHELFGRRREVLAAGNGAGETGVGDGRAVLRRLRRSRSS